MESCDEKVRALLAVKASSGKPSLVFLSFWAAMFSSHGHISYVINVSLPAVLYEADLSRCCQRSVRPWVRSSSKGGGRGFSSLLPASAIIAASLPRHTSLPLV